jgi:hypothetical protein
LPLDSLRFHSTYGELSASTFISLKACNACESSSVHVLGDSLDESAKPGNIPVLFAFSDAIARDACRGTLPYMVVLPHVCEHLGLPPPTLHTRSDSVDVASKRDFLRYPWPCPLHVVKLSWGLKPPEYMQTTIHQSAALLVGPEDAFDATLGIEDRLPSVSTIYDWQVKMDMLTSLWERVLLSHDNFTVRHLAADMSPQVSYNFLCMREERFSLPMDTFENARLIGSCSYAAY